MSELAYSLHLGSDKNRKNISKQNGKNNLSGTTSLPNNAIQNIYPIWIHYIWNNWISH